MPPLLRSVLALPSRAVQAVLLGVVQFYRLFFRAWLGSACRFEPTCSTYALEALRRHGGLRGGWLMTGRLMRCHPWCPGGHDPVPPATSTPLSLPVPAEPAGPPRLRKLP